jgi:4-aminobutyrate aminotransferase-like enzyme
VKEKVESLQKVGTAPSAFIAEPLSGNAGGVILPPTYLKKVYEIIHEAGGLCINDEVQVGYGRLGNVFWGFEEHGIIPDILTMAKAAGNGHPVGYVITSEAIASEFHKSQGSFFSSAGGGPVSCVIGMTVLDVIQEEELQNNALTVGNYLQEKLLAIQKKYPHIIGCIHGHGLYQGIEIIKTTAGRQSESSEDIPVPGTEEAYALCDRLLELGVITHNTGDYSNVLKIKPPLCFSQADADFYCEAVEIALEGW